MSEWALICNCCIYFQINTQKKKYLVNFFIIKCVNIFGELQLLSTGIAIKSLQGLQLYPMVSSTAAQSAMRVIYAVSQPVDLKLLSLQALRNDSHMMGQLALVPGLKRFIDNTWWIGSGKSTFFLFVLYSTINVL